jgi:hypothetical protein
MARSNDVSGYAEKAPTDYHKVFARWIVQEVGFDPDTASSKRAAFLRGVSIATAARPAFMNSEMLEEWRERNGINKRGPKPKADEDFDDDAPAPKATRSRNTAKNRRVREPEPEVEEFDEDADDAIEDFDDDSDDVDTEFDDDSDDSDDDDFEEEVKPTPKRAARRTPHAGTRSGNASRATKSASAGNRRTAANARNATNPRKATAPKGRRTSQPAQDDDDFAF